MKTLMFAALLAIGGAAAAQTMPGTAAPSGQAPDQGTAPAPSAGAQDVTQGAGAGPVAVPRTEAVAPPGYNTPVRAVPPEQAAQAIGRLTGYDYPPCTRQVQDRCAQARGRAPR